MNFFDKIKERNANKDSVFGNTATINGTQYDRYELEKKVKENKPMTEEEHRALEKFRQKELSNQIARVVGVVSIVVIIILAIGCFLYPYSIFNLFGDGDRFWDCWNHLSYHVSSNDINHFMDYKLSLEGSELDMWKSIHDVNGSGGWLNLQQIMRMAFEDGTSFKVNFITIGAWSVIVLSTIGFVAAIFLSIYMLAYNISDLFKLIHKGVNRTTENLHDVKDAVVNSVTGRDNERTITITKQEPKKPAARKKKTTQVKVEEPVEEKIVEPEVKSEEEIEEDEINAKIEALKKEAEAEEKVLEKQEPTTEAVTAADVAPARRNAKTAEPDYENLSDDELTAMLSK